MERVAPFLMFHVKQLIFTNPCLWQNKVNTTNNIIKNSVWIFLIFI